MGVLRYPLILIWRVWYYVLMGMTIIVLSPFLIVYAAREEYYPKFYKFARVWAYTVTYGMGMWPEVTYRDIKNIVADPTSKVLISNHKSMIDIMLMLMVSPEPFVFVGKAELSKLPIFGYFYKRVCILVDRNNAQSRAAVFNQAQRRIKAGTSICIYPEGGVPVDPAVKLDTFRRGAFKLATEHNIPIQPFTFLDAEKRFPFWFFRGKPGKLRVRILAPMYPADYENGKDMMTAAHDLILADLLKHQ